MGSKAPNVTLANAQGRPVKLGDLWARGPLVVIFQHGRSAVDCALQLRKWTAWQGALEQLEAHVAVVCLERLEPLVLRTAAHGGGFDVLEDASRFAARAFGMWIPLAPETIDLYTSAGPGGQVCGGRERRVFPTPATYLIDQDGRIVLAQLASDERIVEPEDLLAIIEALRRQGEPEVRRRA
jgi:peroxiredoxin